VTEPTDTAAEVAPRPVLRIVRGTPDPTEVAALVAVFAAAAAGGASSGASGRARRAAWSSPSRLVRSPLAPGGWRASAAPR
jgi:hypothetical protein